MSKYTILFYGANWFYSNFSPYRFWWQGHYWATAEHAYQAWKYFGLNTSGFFDGKEVSSSTVFMMIVNAKSPGEAKGLGGKFKSIRDPDWDKKKLRIMEQIIRAKLEAHQDKIDELCMSWRKEIIEDSPTDSYWGRGPDWNGKNYLGKIWMKLRDEETFIQLDVFVC